MYTGKLINREKLLRYFTEHLNLVYCAKIHLVNKLPMIVEYATFSDLKNALLEIGSDLNNQVARMDRIYSILGAAYTPVNCATTQGLIEDFFIAIGKENEDTILRDLSILFYMQNMESIEVSSFKVLQLIATVLKNTEISQLIRESFDESTEDRQLMVLINAKYLIN